MGENEMKKKTEEKSSYSSSENPIQICSPTSSFSSSSSSSELEEQKEDGTPLRPIFCLKKKVDLEAFDEIEDCFILDFDPFESVDLSKLSVDEDDDDYDDRDLAVIAERGQVACRDYPHSRHLCLKFPFEETAHASHCKLCFCYVCDSAAPCESWIKPQSGHCHATEDDDDWKLKRKLTKQLQTK